MYVLFFYRNKDRVTNNSKDTNDKISYNINEKNQDSVKEVIVKNGIPNLYDRPINNNNNNLNNNMNNNNDNNHVTNLGLPPAIAPGFSSDTKL